MGNYFNRCHVLTALAILLLSCLVVGTLFFYQWANSCSKENSNSTMLNSTSLEIIPKLNESHFYNKTDDDVDDQPTECSGPEWNCNIRLDDGVLPVHYDLYLHPDMDIGLFTGRVSITLNITNSVDHVRLHVHKLNVTSTMITKSLNYEQIQLNETFEIPENQYWVVIPKNDIAAGMYVLSMEFNGNLTKDIVGLYRSQYLDTRSNTHKYVVSSKFQPTYARMAFPCMDEPGFKSTYNVILVKPHDLVALSNMPVKTEDPDTPESGLTTVHFEKSVPMVTYLVAFAIGDFAYTEGHTRKGVPVRIYSTSFQVNKTQYVSSIVPDIVDYFEEYFDTKYSLPKLDIIGIPDFVSGAMEHWGLISFRETNLFWQKGVNSAVSKQRVTAVIAHELAHMWFGNLMTLKWWNDLWINEGFASYMEYKGVSAVHADWEMEQQFVGDDLALVLQLDGQHSSHPIVQSVSHPDQITELFDTISYSKGASVIRMLENFVGNERFRKGIANFLKKFSFKNAVTEDMWGEIQLELYKPKSINVSSIMDTWTRQMGYPIITPEISKNGTLIVRQQKFIEGNDKKAFEVSKKSNPNPTSFDYRWDVPLQIFYQDAMGYNFTKLVWIPRDKEAVEFPNIHNWKWLTLNSGQYGYYRVKYPVNMLTQFQASFFENFSPRERCGLIDDVFSLASANYMQYHIAMDFINVLVNETHYVPWVCSDTHIKSIGRLLNTTIPGAYDLYSKFVLQLVTKAYHRFNWTDNEKDRHLDRLLKPRIFSLACKYGMKDCLEKTKDLFTKWVENSNDTILPGLRDVVYKWGMWQSPEPYWQKILERYIKESDPQEKHILLKALASTQDISILERLLDMAKNSTIVRRQDFFSILRYISNNPVGRDVAWKYYRTEYEALINRFTINNRQLGRAIGYLTVDFTTPSKLHEMTLFFEKYPNAGAGARARESALERVRHNMLWKIRNAPVIRTWLSVHSEFRIQRNKTMANKVSHGAH